MRAGEVCRPSRRKRSERGFTYVWLLAALALLSIGLGAVGPSWSDQVRRDRERDLLHVGSMYASAIAAYYKGSPGSAKEYPARLEDLLSDRRMIGTVRHLRKLYADPLDPSRPWGLVFDPAGRIRGVYSQSTDAPLRVEVLDLDNVTLAAAKRYSDWKFIAKVLS